MTRPAWSGCCRVGEVAALTETTASIRSAAGNITIYRKHNKPALGHPGHPSVPAPAFLRVK
jgi:hypothetical protein